MGMRRIRTIAGLAATTLALAASLLLASAASASGDRNRDRIPDRWERQHHLSLKVNQAKRDQDGDGLDNRGEWKAKLDPRDDDSDDDGIEDGDENAGTITSFEGGVLTITLAKGGTLVANVTDVTEVECDDATAAASSDCPGDDGEDEGDGQHDHGDDEDHGDDHCGPEALTAGRQVAEAELKTLAGEAVWEKVELGA
jgi:hypothetical protein